MIDNLTDFNITDKFNPSYLGFIEVKNEYGSQYEATIKDMEYRLSKRVSMTEGEAVFILEYKIHDYPHVFGGFRYIMTIGGDDWNTLMNRLEYMITFESRDAQDKYAVECVYNALLRKTKIARI